MPGIYTFYLSVGRLAGGQGSYSILSNNVYLITGSSFIKVYGDGICQTLGMYHNFGIVI